VNVAAFNRTLDQELLAVLRGTSLECLVCGEFLLLLADGSRFCPECGSALRREEAMPAGATMEPQAG
jgi:predicted RNA-binding Zn-ribbon protein involved in translation (DUF1610 family)